MGPTCIFIPAGCPDIKQNGNKYGFSSPDTRSEWPGRASERGSQHLCAPHACPRAWCCPFAPCRRLAGSLLPQPEGCPLHGTGSSWVCILGLGMVLASFFQARFPPERASFPGPVGHAEYRRKSGGTGRQVLRLGLRTPGTLVKGT